jgi:molybdate/tungstate transport system ATP-binding protein
MIELCELNGRLGDFSLKNINLKVHDGEYLVLLGPTGAGKSVLIEYIVGIFKQDEGRILVDGEDITSLYTEERNIAYVPQDYALFPNLTVEKNIAYGLEARSLPAAEIKRIVSETIAKLRLEHLRHRMPQNLSGGEKQRVALGRALATEPKLVLLDEPLSALDENLRTIMAKELKILQRNTQATFIHVCHNFEEASDVADRIAIMNEGEIVQVGTLDEVKAKPKNDFVVRFLKTNNIFNAVSNGNTVTCNGLTLNACSGFSGEVILAIRPEHILINCNGKDGDSNTLPGKIVNIASKPHLKEITVDIGMHLAVYSMTNSHEIGDLVRVHIPNENLIVMQDSKYIQ